MISGIKAAEEMLAREQTKQEMADMQKVVDGLPDDHPLVVEWNKNMAMASDLHGLPSGHPLFKALADAKRRHDEKLETDEAQDRATEQRTKRQERDREAERAKAADEEMERQARRMASKTLNDQIGRTTGQMESLYESMRELSDTLQNDPYSRVKLKKMERILYASKRGLDECRFSMARI
jgi:hypothetical protein